MTTVKVSLLLVIVTAVVLAAQEPAFEVASVKPTTAPGAGWALPQGEARFEGSLLDVIIPVAFDVPMQVARLKIVWTAAAETLRRNPRFQILAEGDPKADSRAMLRTLLKERFSLRAHTELRQVPIYALIVKEPGKLGQWLKRSQVNCREDLLKLAKAGGGTRAPQCTYGLNEQRFGAQIHRWAGTIDELIMSEAQANLPRPVINATGLEGSFEWEIAVGSRPDVPNIFTAFEDQLGLKLEERTGPWEVIVIDDLRMPTPN